MYLYKKTGKVGSTVPASPGQARFMCEFIVAGYIKRIDPDEYLKKNNLTTN